MIKLKSQNIISRLNQQSILGFLFVLLNKENGGAVCAQTYVREWDKFVMQNSRPSDLSCN